MTTNFFMYTGWAYAASTAACMVYRTCRAAWKGTLRHECSHLGQSLKNTALTGLVTFPAVVLLSNERTPTQLLQMQSACFGLTLPYFYYQAINQQPKKSQHTESKSDTDDEDVDKDVEGILCVLFFFLGLFAFLMPRHNTKNKKKHMSKDE